MNLIATLVGLFGPFIVWPLEILAPYPFIVEELFKLAVVNYIIKNSKLYKDGLNTSIFSGILFAVSETVLYILKINAYGSISLIFIRLISTSILHSLTFVVIYIACKKKYYWILGLAVAILIHFGYNLYI